MDLPIELLRAIETKLSLFPASALQKSVENLSTRYRSAHRSQKFLMTEADYLGYLVTRFPATYAAIGHTLQELQNRLPGFQPKSLLDLGAGPGTAFWATNTFFSTLIEFSLFEKDEAFIKLGKSLIESKSSQDSQVSLEWVKQDLQTGFSLSKHDLTLVSYVLNELDNEQITRLMPKVWDATDQVLVILEPGSKKGSANILQVRKQLIEFGAFIAAPCPQQGTCPLSSDDWCHFSTRLSRSALHRKLKQGTLAFEDEKFSYIIAARKPLTSFNYRILRHPFKQKGHIQFTLCHAEGIKHYTVSKREKATFARARKARWGDVGDDLF